MVIGMAAGMKRLSLAVTPEVEQKFDELKQKMFYNRSYSEMYRYILSSGINAVKSGAASKKKEV